MFESQSTTQAINAAREQLDSVVNDVEMKEQVSEFGRSVLDYDTPEELRQALEERMAPPDGPCEYPPSGKSDWLLPVPDPDAEPQSVQTEMQRLLTLKSYLILDEDREEAFDQLTREACQVYNVPTSLVSLIDLGRQFLLSNTGAGVRETSRSSAFCSHTILSKTGICVVPDTENDLRFRKNCLVTGGPKLRFYAGAPLISPEGYKLGTFCVEGPEPRPQGLSEEERAKLKEFAARAMSLMVQRRATLQRAYSAANMPENAHLRRHAAIATNLGSLVYKHYLSDSVIAMCLLQEAVTTLMHIEGDSTTVKLSSSERQEQMSQLFASLSSTDSQEARDACMQDIRTLFPESAHCSIPVSAMTPATHTIPGVFGSTSKLKPQLILEALFFNETFDVSMEVPTFDPNDPHSSIDDRSFIIPLNQCAKASLFNMGLIHYHWGSADNAMQFFDLAASLSKPHEATNFDPVILGCLNNMAQIHLQFNRPTDAMDMLTDALTRGNSALSTIYSGGPDDTEMDTQDHDNRRTKRLRRKLARTVLNIGHVHFHKCEYDASMRACNDALMLLHTNPLEVEVAAVWYNMGLLYYHRGKTTEALEQFDKFLQMCEQTVGVNAHLSEAYYRKGKALFELGRLEECLSPLHQAFCHRRTLNGENHPSVAESLYLIGKVLIERKEFDAALKSLQQALVIQKANAKHVPEDQGQGAALEITQTLFEIGRVYHAESNLTESLAAMEEVIDLTSKFFGDRHPFVANIHNIMGNLLVEKGEKEESLRYFQSALDINQEHSAAAQPDTAAGSSPTMMGS